MQPPYSSSRWSVVIIVTAVLHFLMGLSLGSRPFDDTFISYRYAANVAHGYGLVYNINEHVLGTTTPLWAFVLAACSFVGLTIPTAAFFLSLGLDLLIGLLIVLLLRRFGYSEMVASLSAVLFFGTFDYLSIARSGMETSLFVCLIFVNLYFGLRRWWLVAAFSTFLICMTRPEGILLPAILMLQFAVGWKQRDLAEGYRAVAGATVFIMLLTGWLVWTNYYYGSIIPQSIRAKATFASHDPGLSRFSWYNFCMFFVNGQYGSFIFTRNLGGLNFIVTLLAAVAIVSLLWRLIKEPCRPAAMPAITLLCFPITFGGVLSLTHAFTFFPWYYGPLYPFGAILAVLGVNHLAQGLHQRANAYLVPVLVGVLVCAQAMVAILIKIPADRDFFWVKGLTLSVEAVPNDPNLKVATREIGVIGWKLWPAHVSDLIGLVTPQALHVSNVEYLSSSQPDYLLLRTDDAAALLVRLAETSWFSTNYELVFSVEDPSRKVAYQTFRHRKTN